MSKVIASFSSGKIHNQWKISLGTFPHVFLELTETEVGDYFKPSDLMIGKTVNIYGRNFLIYDCDMFTKTFYAKNFGVSHFEPVETQIGQNEFPKMVKIDRRDFRRRLTRKYF